MMKRNIIGAIADIDDTLIPWELPHSLAYPAMSRALSKKSGLPEKQIIEEIKAVNSKYGTIEYTALIQEMPAFRDLSGGKQQELINLAIRSRREAIRGLNEPYPGVEILLETLRTNRLIRVALSDAPVNLAYLRLKKAKLLAYFDLIAGRPSPNDKLFAPEHRMGNKPYLIPVETVEEQKPHTNLRQLLNQSDKQIRSNYVLFGNSAHSDRGLARRYGMLFYQTGWNNTTAEMRETLLNYAPEPVLAANVGTETPSSEADFETHPDFELVEVDSPLSMIRDLKRRGIIEQLPPEISA